MAVSKVEYFANAGTLIVLITAAVNDVRKGKIPNVLLIILMGSQIVLEIISIIYFHTLPFSGVVIVKKLFVFISIIGFLYPFFALGELGAGDVKLLAVSSLCIEDPLSFVLWSFITALIISLVKIAKNGGTKDRETGKKLKVKLAVPVLISYVLLWGQTLWNGWERGGYFG